MPPGALSWFAVSTGRFELLLRRLVRTLRYLPDEPPDALGHALRMSLVTWWHWRHQQLRGQGGLEVGPRALSVLLTVMVRAARLERYARDDVWDRVVRRDTARPSATPCFAPQAAGARHQVGRRRASGPGSHGCDPARHGWTGFWFPC
ncbi:hypothetical protein DMB38_15650 [Streptomyces sp. WAC 06738]|nr:hypothetical protein DMB38_15650 [Streptomyces sp. WAC 06738]